MEGFDREKYAADLKAAADDESRRLELEADYEEKERRARRRSTGNVQVGFPFHNCSVTRWLKKISPKSSKKFAHQ